MLAIQSAETKALRYKGSRAVTIYRYASTKLIAGLRGMDCTIAQSVGLMLPKNRRSREDDKVLIWAYSRTR